MKVLFTKDGKRIKGTLEQVEGVCPVSVPSDGDPSDHTQWEFADHTEMFWDSQMTARDMDQVIFLDEDGEEVLESDVVWTEVGEE